MKLKSIFLLASVPAISFAGSQLGTLDAINYNFQISGGGGGASATFTPSGSTASNLLEIYCVDFANTIYVPSTDSAYLTPLLSASGSTDTAIPGELSVTRDGGVTSWTALSTFGESNSFIDGASALERYQMAAYLVSQYTPDPTSATDQGIQEAIWEIMDPSTDPSISAEVSPLGVALNSASVTNALTSASNWLTSFTSQGTAGINSLNAFLSNYRIVSDSTMSTCAATAISGALCGGFQEQITAVPEPRYIAFLLVGLLVAFGSRRKWMIS